MRCLVGSVCAVLISVVNSGLFPGSLGMARLEAGVICVSRGSILEIFTIDGTKGVLFSEPSSH